MSGSETDKRGETPWNVSQSLSDVQDSVPSSSAPSLGLKQPESQALVHIKKAHEKFSRKRMLTLWFSGIWHSVVSLIGTKLHSVIT
jgi:hypothetical protein